MSARPAHNGSFVGLDLSLSGSHIIPVGSNADTATAQPPPMQTPKKGANRPTSARSYIMPRTKSTENLNKKPDTGRSVANTNRANGTKTTTKYPVPTTPSKAKNESKDSVDTSRQSNAFKQLTARSSYDDDNSVGDASRTLPPPKSTEGFKSMFLLDEFKKPIAPAATVKATQESTLYKDSLDVSNSVIKAKNGVAPQTNQNQVIDEDEAWKNEMLIYEKYLKEDLENYGKHLKELDAGSVAGSTKNSLQVDRSTARNSHNMANQADQATNGADDHQNKRMQSFNKGLAGIAGNNDSNQKIEKLKSSVDHLRRAFHTDIQTTDVKYNNNSNSNSVSASDNTQHREQRLYEIRRRISTRKIQRWYRRHNLRKKAGEAALKRLMAQKREEIANKEKEEREKRQKEELLEKQKKEKASHIRQQRVRELSRKRDEAAKAVEAEKQLVSASVKSSYKPNTNRAKSPSTPKNVLKSSRSDANSIKTELLEDSTNHSASARFKASIDNSQNLDTANDTSVLESSTKSKTIDNLFETLKELEKIETFPSPPRSSNHLYESSETLVEEKSEKPTKANVTAASITNQKLNSILTFLDDVETENNNAKQIQSNRPTKNKTNILKAHNDLTDELKKKPLINNFFERQNENETKASGRLNASSRIVAPIVPSAEEIEDLEKATQSAAEVTETMLSQRLELEEKKRTISMLQKALNQQRELTIRHTKEAEKELDARLNIQKQEYEATIQRHLSFIDQLIDDKKNLSEKCEKLVKELKEVDKKYTDRIRSIEETFRVETQKMRDMHEAAEKIRREKWIDEKTKKIKEMTVKGLEPEIQNLIAKHKYEIKTLKSMHEAELLQADERASQRYVRMVDEIRQNFEQDKELSVNKEREMAKQRYEKSLQDEEKSFLEQRRRLYAEIEEEKNRIAEQGTKQRLELDRLRKNLEENNLNAIEAMKKEYEAARSEQEKRHQTELKEIRQRLDLEKQSWEENYMKKQENILAQKERELRDQVKRDRDKEIELVISRLESETTLTRDESERAAENRVKRIRDKYETELREVEKTERETTERYNAIKAKYNELEGEYERAKVVVRQKDKELEDIHKITETLQTERSRLADIIRQEFSDRLVFTEEESKRIKLEMAEVKSKHQYEIDRKKEEIERLQREKDEELNKVHERIKQAISKKEEVVSQLKQQYEAACKRADHLEGLLEQQRKLMVGKK